MGRSKKKTQKQTATKIEETTVQPKSKNERTKEWLENNKIYFETAMEVILSLAAIFISCISIYLQQNSNEMQEKQMYLENMPIFNMSTSTVYYEDDYLQEPVPVGKEIKIVNNGGNITDATLTNSTIIKIHAFNSNSWKTIDLYLRLHDGVTYGYDALTKSFTFKNTDGDLEDWYKVNDLITELNNQLDSEYENYSFFIYPVDFIYVDYVNFEGDLKHEEFTINGESLSSAPTVDQRNSIYLVGELDETEYSEIRTKIVNSTINPS